jgi:hypothetical protein
MGDPNFATNQQIEHDYKRAHDRIDHYNDRIKAIATIRGECYTAAQSAFDKFINMKADPDAVTQIASMILFASTVMMPALGLAVAIGQSFAKAQKAADQLEQLEKMAQQVERMNKKIEYVSKAKEHKELGKAQAEAREASEQGEKLTGNIEDSLSIIKEDNDLLTKANEMLDFVREQLIDYEDYYTKNPTKYLNYSLYNLANEILSGTDINFTHEDIEQITNNYLYELIRAYCKRFPPITFTHGGGVKPYYTITGLNDNQQEWILNRFGISVMRGKYFIGKYIVDLEYTLLNIWGVTPIDKEEHFTHQGHNAA